ncbi:multiheme c-type cytochrome [Zavarzinella formosa]|uniref:multiheme c-type cytochrome n=1 Tax=Zavarzinella formosa TaxID=360055 RepID=UPI000317BD0C|nr:multiheme c-type cytochrome [Zavarzinella formosa]
MATTNSPRPSRGRYYIASLVLIAGLAAIGWVYADRYHTNELLAADPPKKSEPQELFTHWPTKGKPEMVIVVTGQTNGYIQKCGCSNPQKGGLDRRYNFMESLRAKGWEVVGLDLGDVMKPLDYTPTFQQTLSKYECSMQSMKLMGYQGVGVGVQELTAQLLNPLAKYSAQKGNETPKVHFANIDNRDEFPNANGGSALVESDIITAKTGLNIGVVGIVGAEIQTANPDNSVKFSPRPGPVLNQVLKGWAKAKNVPDLNVLMYNGPLDWKDPRGVKADAESIAAAHPQFHVVICLSNDAEPPNMPKKANNDNTIIVQVGHKGQNVGVIGVYKIGGAIQLFYQRVAITDEFDTPAGKEADHPVLKTLQDYSNTVRDNDYLSDMRMRKKDHTSQILFKNAAYVGDGQCVACHQAEHAAWFNSKHAGAYKALETSVKPTGRQFDGECIICHTVGYDYKTGFVNDKVTKHLMNVQCESCHGPGNLHVDEEQANLKLKKPTSKYLAMLSPWKAGNPNAKLPSVQKFAAMAAEKDTNKQYAMLDPVEQPVYQGVIATCAKCHDPENDPHFDLINYWKNVVHTGLVKKPVKPVVNQK